MFGNNSVPKGGFNAFKTPSQNTASQQSAKSGDMQYAGGTPYFDERTGQRTGPGQAQSMQTPSTGTKYGAYAPPRSQTTGDPRGAYANAPPSQRPPPMQIAPAQTPFGPSMDPFAERDAFVRQIGQQRINNQIAFNTSGPNAPQGSPFINYGMAAQNAGLAGGAPSMNANPEDTFIGRFNNQYGAPVNPGFGGGQSQNAYYPGGPGGFPVQQQSPGSAQPIAQPAQGTPYRQPSPQPQYGTPPDGRGGMRTADFRDADNDRVDDRDQDGPGMPAYGSPGRAQPIAPQQPESYYPGFDPRNQSPTVQPAPRPPAKDSNRAMFLQQRSSSPGGQTSATYDDYVKSGLDTSLQRLMNSSNFDEIYGGTQSTDPAKARAYRERMENMLYGDARNTGVAPSDDWFARKTGQSSAAGRAQYVDNAISRYRTKSSRAAADDEYAGQMQDRYMRNPMGPDRQGYQQAMQAYRNGSAQPVQPQSLGMPYEYAPNLPPGTTAADIQQGYNTRQAALANAPPQNSGQLPRPVRRPDKARR